MKKIILIFLLATSYQNCFAQSANGSSEGNVYDHYIGVQINGLVRQVININNASATTSGNPYLLTYDMINKRSGWGVRAGIGYNSVNTSNSTASSDNSTNNSGLQLRIGIEKAFKLSGKWAAAAGIDIVYNYTNNNTTNNEYYQYDTTLSSTKTLLSSYGGGPFGKLSYQLTNKLVLGTECSFYYVTGTKNQTLYSLTTNQPGTAPSIINSTPSSAVSTSTINLPIIFYLSVKF